MDLATGCSAAHLPGGPPSAEAQTLVQRLYALLHRSRVVDVEDLRITHKPARAALVEEEEEDDEGEMQEETVAYWTLYASIHVLSLDGSSSLVDVAWAALVAALRDVKLPRARWEPDLEAVVCSDRVDEARALNLRGLPVCCTWGVFVAAKAQMGMQSGSEGEGVEARGKGVSVSVGEAKTLDDGSKAWLLADPDEFEDPLCRETVSVTVDASAGETRVLRIEKSGGGVVGVAEMRDLVVAATERWKEWAAALDTTRR